MPTKLDGQAYACLRVWIQKAEKELGKDWERCDKETGRECLGVKCAWGAHRALVYLNRAIEEMNSPLAPRRRSSRATDLTVCDWEEVAAAIWTKRAALKQGRYGPDDIPGDTRRWIRHMDEITRKIGADGHRACRRYDASADCGHDHPGQDGAVQALRRLIRGHSKKDGFSTSLQAKYGLASLRKSLYGPTANRNNRR